MDIMDKNELTKLTINVPTSKKEKLQKIAKEQGITMTALIILIMNEIIEKGQIKNPL